MTNGKTVLESDTAMLDWNFENDDGRAPQMHYVHRYVVWAPARVSLPGALQTL